MPQLSLYLDQKTMDLVEKMAKIDKTSISKWVGGKLKSSVKNNWPIQYFDNYGVLAEDDFAEIKDLSLSEDTERETL